MVDLFGNVPEFAMTPAEKRKIGIKRKSTPPKGYAALPGSGPKGETCGSCASLYRNRLAKTYLKCALMKAHWTGGGGSDVRARSPACRNWSHPPSREDSL